MDVITRPLRVFLCHSTKDWQIAHDLYEQLNRAGWLDVWFVSDNLDFNQNWDAEIHSSVNRADVVIALISRHSYQGEAHSYPDPNFVFNIIEANPRADLLLLPLIVGRSGVPREMIANGLDYSRKNQRHVVGQQILADLRKYSDENGFATDGSLNDLSSESGIQWSPTRWKELKNPFDDSTENGPDGKTRLQESLRHRSGIGARLFVPLLLGALIIIAGIGMLVNFVNDNSDADFADSPLIGKALTILTSPTSDVEQEPAIPPAFEPSAGDVQFSTVDGASLVYVPAGSFMMGGGYEAREQPAHSVNLSAFWMDKFEVTNERYAKCVKAGICSPPAFKKFYDDPVFKDHPVVYVNWDAAKTYCEWSGRRLPTEAEWEKAARGVDKKGSFPWGGAINCEFANYNKDTCVGGTTAVGSYPEGHSPYGVLDMAGNVWEWVSDWYDETYYTQSYSVTNPQGPQTGEHKVLRGGSWISTMNYLRTTDRWRNLPDYNSDFIGFRCAMPAAD